MISSIRLVPVPGIRCHRYGERVRVRQALPSNRRSEPRYRRAYEMRLRDPAPIPRRNAHGFQLPPNAWHHFDEESLPPRHATVHVVSARYSLPLRRLLRLRSNFQIGPIGNFPQQAPWRGSLAPPADRLNEHSQERKARRRRGLRVVPAFGKRRPFESTHGWRTGVRSAHHLRRRVRLPAPKQLPPLPGDPTGRAHDPWRIAILQPSGVSPVDHPFVHTR